MKNGCFWLETGCSWPFLGLFFATLRDASCLGSAVWWIFARFSTGGGIGKDYGAKELEARELGDDLGMFFDFWFAAHERPGRREQG